MRPVADIVTRSPDAGNGDTGMPRYLLRLDSAGGLVNGVVMLAFSVWLQKLYQLPHGLLVGIGVINLAYGSYSGFLVRHRPPRPRALIVALAVANATWACICLMLAARYAGSATWLGIGYLMFEAMVVGGLAILEWRARDVLVRV